MATGPKTVEKTSLISALEISEPPNRLNSGPDLNEDRTRWEIQRLESSLDGYSRMIGQTQSEFERHILGRDDYERLVSLREELERTKNPPPFEETDEVLPTPTEDHEKRDAWRKAVSDFHPYRLIGERIQKADPDLEVGGQIMSLFLDAVDKAKGYEYDAAIENLRLATEKAKQAQAAINREKERVTRETAEEEEEQIAAFSMVVRVEDSEYGFDTDTDAKYFYLANTVNEVGVFEKSETLLRMESVLKKAVERKVRLEKAGASIDEILSTAFKHIPEAFWPDSIVKEVQLYNAVTAQIEAEKGIEEAEDVLEKADEISETFAGVLENGSSLNEWAAEKFGEESEKVKQVTETAEAFFKGFTLANELTGATFKGVSALDKTSELEEIEDNPVKAKIVEFERNKAIVACVNSLVGLGLEEASDFVPVLGAVVKGKDALVEATKAGYYFKNTLDLKKLTKGARVDPRSAALLPLARLAREQKIAMSEAALKSLASALETAGKAGELAGITAPAGLAIDVTGKIVKYGGTAIITGINFSDAKKAANLMKQAAGPPPIRRAQIEVMKYASQYAKVAVVHLAMKEHDPWAIGHLENVGLGRLDIDHPATSSKLIREYMALKAGGLLGESQGEDQFEDGIVMKLVKGAGGGIASGAEWIRDKLVGRDTSIEYDPSWRPGPVDYTIEGWTELRKEAIAAGWYDSRPRFTEVLTTYGQAQTAYNQSYGQDLDTQIRLGSELYSALQGMQAASQEIEPLANDRTTEHAGMRQFAQQWWDLAISRMRQVSTDRSRLIDSRDFPGLEGEGLEQAKNELLARYVEEAKVKQSENVKARKGEIERMWDAHRIKTPWVTCKLHEFPQKVKSGFFTFGARGAMDFHESEVSELVVEVSELRIAVLDRLNRELMASPEEELASNFTASALTVDKFVVEALRAKCEDIYHTKMRREGATESSLWSPADTDIVLDHTQWRRVITAAKEGGWDQEENTGFTDAIESYEEALREFRTESQKDTPNPTVVEQKRGLILGSLDRLEENLRAFKPVTKQKFHHPGLIEYKSGMLELCLAERIKYTA